MRIKTLLLYILLFCLLASTAMAEGDTDAGLDIAEIRTWVQNVLDYRSKNLQVEPQIEESDIGYQYNYGGIQLYYDSKDSASQKLVGVRLSEALLTGPRGERLFDEQNSLLSLYPNDNPALIGDRDSAFLFLDNELPEMAYWGILGRDGQRINSVEYLAHVREGERYTALSLQFELEFGSLTSIAVFGLNESLEQAAVLENIAYVERVRELHSYYAYPSSTNGKELLPFGREDLLFSGIDFLSLTPEILIERFGSPDIDEMSQVDTLHLRSLSWDALDVSFAVTPQGKTLYCYRFSIRDDIMEGPRGLRIADQFPSVYSRFRNEERELDENNNEVLYGNFGEAEFGVVSYYPNGIEMSMQSQIQLDNGNIMEVVLTLSFEGSSLQEITLYTND